MLHWPCVYSLAAWLVSGRKPRNQRSSLHDRLSPFIICSNQIVKFVSAIAICADRWLSSALWSLSALDKWYLEMVCTECGFVKHRFVLFCCQHLLSALPHLSSDDGLKDKREDCQNCSVLYCVPLLCTVTSILVWSVLTT